MIQLTDEQQNLISTAVKWYFSAESGQVFQYSAPAGAGKSTVMHAIIEGIGLDDSEVAPMAYTGAAAIVMRINGFSNACTIHSWLYTLKETSVLDESTNKFKKKHKFVYRGISPAIYRLICIDEASMVPNHMLQDILRSGIKVLVCGDLNQLPPVNDNPAFLYNGEVHYLSKIMRQAEGSAIVELSRKILNGVDLIPGDYGEVVVLTQSDFNKYMNQIISSNDIVICGLNSTRDNLNNLIRTDILGKHGTLPKLGEKIICRKNNWTIDVDGINLANGLCGTVKSNPDISNFNKGGIFEIDFTPDLFPYITFSNIKCDYKYLMADSKTRREMKTFNSPLYRPNGEKFEFGYCITTHLSQGSQYKKGVYLQEFMMGGRDINIHLNYTGLTRFREFCVFVVPDRRVYIPIVKHVVTLNKEFV